MVFYKTEFTYNRPRGSKPVDPMTVPELRTVIEATIKQYADADEAMIARALWSDE